MSPLGSMSASVEVIDLSDDDTKTDTSIKNIDRHVKKETEVIDLENDDDDGSFIDCKPVFT